MAPSFFCALALAILVTSTLPAQETTPARQPIPPRRIIARVNGVEITEDHYRAHLFRTLGRRLLDDYVDRLLVVEEAQRLKISVPYEEVEREVERQLERTHAVIGGGPDRLWTDLETRGFGRNEYLARVRAETLHRMVLDRCIVATREVSDEDLRDEYRRRFGEEGVRRRVRCFIVHGAERPGSLAFETKWKRAATVLRRVRGGEDFSTIVEAAATDATSRTGGEPTLEVVPGRLGSEFDRAVALLERPGEVSSVIHASDGFRIAQLIEKESVAFEEIEPELRRTLETAPVTDAERNRFLERLRERTPVEVVPVGAPASRA